MPELTDKLDELREALFTSFIDKFKTTDLDVDTPETTKKIDDKRKNKDYGFVLIEDHTYDEMMASYNKVPDKKKRKWKSTVTDKWGVKTRVFIENGDLFDKGNVGSRGCVKGKTLIKPQRWLSEGLKKSETSKATTPMGLASKIIIQMKEEHKEFDEQLGHPIIRGMLDDIHQVVMQTIVKSNMTGNHKKLFSTVKCRSNPYGH